MLTRIAHIRYRTLYVLEFTPEVRRPNLGSIFLLIVLLSFYRGVTFFPGSGVHTG